MVSEHREMRGIDEPQQGHSCCGEARARLVRCEPGRPTVGVDSGVTPGGGVDRRRERAPGSHPASGLDQKRPEGFSARGATPTAPNRWVGPEQLTGLGRRGYSGRLSFLRRRRPRRFRRLLLGWRCGSRRSA